MKRSTALFLLSCISLLAGCANPRLLVPGQSTESDVRARMGNPTDMRVDRNGERLLEYATGPQGNETYQVRMGADGRVKEVTQLLTDDQFEKIIPGKQTRSDVALLLGRPTEETTYLPGLTWTWNYLRNGSQPGWLVVTFHPDGTVKDKIAIFEDSGDGPPD